MNFGADLFYGADSRNMFQKFRTGRRLRQYIEGFEHGDAGWAIWRDAILFEGRDEVVDCRFSFVLTLDDGH